MSFWERDQTRTWKSAVDPDGRVVTDPFRPVRINVWYPAGLGGTRMRFEHYVGSARTPGFAEVESFIRASDIGGEGKGLRGLFKSQASFDAFMKTPMLALRDAAAAKGLFPVVVYSLGQGDYTQENIPLAEYLASQGFIVVSVPTLGTSPRRSTMFVHDPPSYQDQVGDLAFAMATVFRRFSSADRKRVAAVGHSMGGVYALLLALRNSSVRVVAGLDPTFIGEVPSYFYKYWETPAFDPARFRGTLLVIHRADFKVNDRIVDSLRYADRTIISVDSSVHADFNGYPAYTRNASSAELDTFALARRTQEQAAATFVALARYLSCYLKSTLSNVRQVADTCPTIPRSTANHLAAAKNLTEEELYDVLDRDGLETAIQRLKSAPTTPLRRAVMSRIVDELGYAGRQRVAAQYAELMGATFPDAAAYERIGDEWMNAGEPASARNAYMRAIRLEPDKKSLLEKLAAIKP